MPSGWTGQTLPNHDLSGLELVWRENIVRVFMPFDHKDPIYSYLYNLPRILAPWTLLIGVGIAGILPTGRYSIVKIGGRRLDRFYGAEGTLTANTNIVQRCRTQVSFRFDSLEDFDRFFANRLGNHIVLVPAF